MRFADEEKALDIQHKMLCSLIKEEWSWTLADTCQNLSLNLIYQNGFGHLLENRFGGHLFTLIESVYPGEGMPWEGKRVPRSFWISENSKRCAIQWLIEKKLRLDPNSSDFTYPKYKDFKTFNLSGLLTNFFRGSIEDAITFAYPSILKQKTNAKTRELEALRVKIAQVLEKELGWSDDEICNKLSASVLHTNGLKNVLETYFNNSVFDLLDFAYPNKFRPWELQRTPRNFWKEKDNQVAAIKWLVQDKLKLDPWTALSSLEKKDFKKNNLGRLLDRVFLGDVVAALCLAYPHIYSRKEKT